MSGTRYMQKIRLCPVQVRCDGATLRQKQEICTRCAKHLKAQGKPSGAKERA